MEEDTYSDGFTSVFSFGVGTHYVLGNGTEASQLTPISIDCWNKAKVKIIQLSCGSTFAMARTGLFIYFIHDNTSTRTSMELG